MDITDVMKWAKAFAQVDRNANAGVHANAPYKIGEYKAYVRRRKDDTQYIELVRPEKNVGMEDIIT